MTSPGVHKEAADHPRDQSEHLNLEIGDGLKNAADDIEAVDGAQGDAIPLHKRANAGTLRSCHSLLPKQGERGRACTFLSNNQPMTGMPSTANATTMLAKSTYEPSSPLFFSCCRVVPGSSRAGEPLMWPTCWTSYNLFTQRRKKTGRQIRGGTETNQGRIA